MSKDRESPSGSPKHGRQAEAARPHVLIAGGGIGGLTLALSLHQLGVRCTVFEAATDVRELGVGINILPHSARVLTALGVFGELDDIAIRTRELRYENHLGQNDNN